ncbi:branched-chain amino acid aminotransferase [Nitratidesulfovibrio vulgaris str. Hildenborough]|uniref:Branched-chain-amino-acid aminotransferase n=2 Tax=Nitratidesulfovibrio vulgaris TaxID=881 RepID=Q725L6_NITV2|nr:branched-chain amino acid aminotransferase [Nitratidesulfovibrio vulgaris str. Hildenborough]
MSMVQKSETIWFDGKQVPWDEANVHVLTHALHYGVGVFEGIRAYRCADGSSAVFRLREHVQRLFSSAKILRMEIPFTEDAIFDAIVETLQRNRLAEGYIRPLSFVGAGAMGVYPGDNPVQTIIAVWPWGAYLGAEALEKGIRVKTSSFARHHVNAMMTKAKASGNYVNSVLAKMEAKADGYDEALMLDVSGFVSEATGENIFMVRNGVIKTTPLTSILDGITRNSLMTLARDLGYEVVEQQFTRDELYVADEAFFCGTAAEVTPIREVDRRVIGKGSAGPVTKHLQQEYFKAVKGDNPSYDHWLHRYAL